MTWATINTEDYENISTHTPLAGRDQLHLSPHARKRISTHTPLAGRDFVAECNNAAQENFYSHAPRGT